MGARRELFHVLASGTHTGNVEHLRTLRTGNVREIRYMNGPDATTRYGMDYGGGLIPVTVGRDSPSSER